MSERGPTVGGGPESGPSQRGSESELPAEEVLPAATSAYGVPASRSAGQDVLHPPRDRYFAVCRHLKEEGFEMCSDLTAVDYLTHPGRSLPEGVRAERFEVAVNLLSMQQRRRVRLRVQVPESDPHLPSLFELWPGSEAMEREAYDLMGVVFDGHPDLTRILMPEDWEGHPLRKDYGVGRVPVQFKATAQ
jgi:NADH-quinone oxidoreductase subunit C